MKQESVIKLLFRWRKNKTDLSVFFISQLW